MEGAVLVRTTTRPAKAFHVILQFSLHDAADGDDITTNARIDQVVFDFAINSLGHLSSIHVLYIVLNLLDTQPLEEGRLRRVLLWIEDTRAAVQ